MLFYDYAIYITTLEVYIQRFELKEQPLKSSPHDLLFRPIRIGSVLLRGRMAKSASVETLCTFDGKVTDELIQHYREIAQGGTPLIITGATSFNLYSRGVPHQISIDSDDKIPGLQRLTQEVHRHDTKIFMQIYHTARQALPTPVGRTDAQAPSAVYEPTLGVMPKAMSLDDIQNAIKGFAQAAERCQKAGFDGIQIHAAHGYLISAFLTPHTNRRKDQYGGSFDNRMRFLKDVYHAIRERVGTNFPIIMKINGSDNLPLRKGLTTSQLVTVARKMEAEGIDAVEISAGHYESFMTFERGSWHGYVKPMLTQGAGQALFWPRRLLMRIFAPVVEWTFNRMAGYSEGFNLNYAEQFTRQLTVPVICVGGLSDKKVISEALAQGRCDMVSAARGFLADPYLYRHMQLDQPGPKCSYCNACFAYAGSQPIGCVDPVISKERQEMLASEASDLSLKPIYEDPISHGNRVKDDKLNIKEEGEYR